MTETSIFRPYFVSVRKINGGVGGGVGIDFRQSSQGDIEVYRLLQCIGASSNILQGSLICAINDQYCAGDIKLFNFLLQSVPDGSDVSFELKHAQAPEHMRDATRVLLQTQSIRIQRISLIISYSAMSVCNCISCSHTIHSRPQRFCSVQLPKS